MRKIIQIGFFNLSVIMLLLGGSSLSYADQQFSQEVAIGRQLIQIERKLAILRTMVLTDEETKAFWPLYDKFQADMAKANDGLISLLLDFPEDYANVSDEHAKKMLKEFIKTEEKRIEVKKKYVEEFMKILPSAKVARLFQAENKLDSLMKMNLAVQVPLIGGGEVVVE